MSKVMFYGFLVFLTPPGLNQAKMGSQLSADVPVRRARARASYRNIMSTVGTPLLAAFSSTRENRVFKPKKDIPGSKSWVGKGAAARPASAAGPKYWDI